MSDLIVRPSYVFTESDVITCDKLNLAATPVVEMALQDPVNDQNFLRNGNFYSSYWKTPTGLACPAGVWTSNANYWYARPSDVVAHTSVTTAFVQPAVAANVTIKVSATGWMSPTQALWIVGGGDYTVVSITDPTTVVVTNTGTAGVNAAPGVTVPVGSGVSPKNTAVVCLRSSVVPDTGSLFSARLTGASAVGTVEWGQQISGDLAATLRQNCTFSGYLYNSTGLTLSPKLEIYSCDAFNNFNTITLQTTVDLQTSANGLWTYVTATLDLSTLTNIANGIWVVVLIPSGMNSASNYALFSRLKFQIGSIATPFTDDVSLFITTPSIDSTMLQDGCIARPSLFLPNVVPTGAYMAKSINNGDINDGAIDSRTLAGVRTTLSASFTQPAVASTVSIAVASSAGFVAAQPITIAGGGAYTVASITDSTHMVVTNTGATDNAAPAANVPTGGAVTFSSALIGGLGYVPVNKAGDIGIGKLDHLVDTAVGAASAANSAVIIEISEANKANAGYFPAIGLKRGTSGNTRAIGLDTTGKFKVVDNANIQGFLLDTVNKVNGGVDILAASITYDRLAASLIDSLTPIGTIHLFAGVNVPGNWFVCDGHTVSRTTYAALFAQLGTYFGGGDGVNTFNLPNFVNRVPVGYGTGANWGFGTLGGEVNHTLSLVEIPSHQHPITDQIHNHGQNPHNHAIVNPVGAQSATPGAGMYSAAGGTQTGDATATNLPSYSNINHTENVGSGGAHNNMPPYAVVYYIIKAV